MDGIPGWLDRQQRITNNINFLFFFLSKSLKWCCGDDFPSSRSKCDQARKDHSKGEEEEKAKSAFLHFRIGLFFSGPPSGFYGLGMSKKLKGKKEKRGAPINGHKKANSKFLHMKRNEIGRTRSRKKIHKKHVCSFFCICSERHFLKGAGAFLGKRTYFLLLLNDLQPSGN